MRTVGDIRFKRLRLVFEGRRLQMDEHRSRSWPPTPKDRSDYATTVVKYTRARTAWRAARGWS